MRLAISVAFLLLLLLFTTVQGIRLKGEPLGAFQGKLQEEKSSAPTVGESPVAGTHLCSEGGRCSGRSRKLITEATPGHKSSTRSEGMGYKGSQRLHPMEEVAGFHASPTASEHRQSAPETYHDIIDISGMDYSPASKKPPIHN
uniref:Peptidase B n=1 Tax=Anthurium amnicola TaxID=1678845 RepID=A0A1D1YNQ0_9ARAE